MAEAKIFDLAHERDRRIRINNRALQMEHDNAMCEVTDDELREFAREFCEIFGGSDAMVNEWFKNLREERDAFNANQSRQK